LHDKAKWPGHGTGDLPLDSRGPRRPAVGRVQRGSGRHFLLQSSPGRLQLRQIVSDRTRTDHRTEVTPALGTGSELQGNVNQPSYRRLSCFHAGAFVSRASAASVDWTGPTSGAAIRTATTPATNWFMTGLREV